MLFVLLLSLALTATILGAWRGGFGGGSPKGSRNASGVDEMQRQIDQLESAVARFQERNKGG